MTKDIMDVKEVAEYLGFSSTKIYRMLTTGSIPNVKVGGQYRFPKAVVDEWLEGKLKVPGETGAKSKTRRSRKVRVEDEIVGHLLAYKTGNAKTERTRAKQIMTLTLDTLDWRYLAAKAKDNGVLDDAIAVEKEINRGG
jgi:excisionase family DNA binding protein